MNHFKHQDYKENVWPPIYQRRIHKMTTWKQQKVKEQNNNWYHPINLKSQNDIYIYIKGFCTTCVDLCDNKTYINGDIKTFLM